MFNALKRRLEMINKINIRSTIASLALVSILTLSGAAAFTSSASAEEFNPPPFPGDGELPVPPSNEAVPPAHSDPAPTTAGGNPEPAPVAIPSGEGESHQPARVLHARMAGQKLVLSLQCSSSGTVGLKGGASQHFDCRAGKGSAAVKLSSKQRQRGIGNRGLRVAVEVREGGSTTQVPLVIRRGEVPTKASASSALVYWNGVAAQCASNGAGQGGILRFETNSLNGFGAAPGERVYWQAYMLAYSNGAWHAYPNQWESYTVSPSEIDVDDYNYTFYEMAQLFPVPARTWTFAGVYVWTPRTGYRFAWVTTNGGGYGNVYSQGGYCYTA
jgi:hypothetical protein